MNLLNEIFQDKDKLLISVILLLLLQEKSDKELIIALAMILLA